MEAFKKHSCFQFTLPLWTISRRISRTAQLLYHNHHLDQSEFPTNESLVGFGDSSGVGFEKVDGFFLIFNVAMDIWISKSDFHMYSQQPPKLSNQNEVWKSSKRPLLRVYLDFLFVLPGTSKSDHCQKQCTMYILSEISV